MKYLHNYIKYNESLSQDEIAECVIDLIDDGFTFAIRSNEPYNYQNIMFKKLYTGQRTTNQFFRCIVNNENIGCSRNIIGWRNNQEIELNDFEKSAILKAINSAEKLLLANNDIKQIKVEAQYFEIMNPISFEMEYCYHITLYLSKK